MNKKLKIDIYKGLPMILEKVKAVALAAVIGKRSSWMKNKLEHYVMKGRRQEFIESDIRLINNALPLLGDEISQYMIQFNPDREDVIRQVKELASYICMPYIYGKVMGKNKAWFDNRKLEGKPGRKVNTFKEDDILAINMAAMRIANELKSIEFVLK